ncbi:hypothetical protein [Hymenobacter psoromatis]|uniref:hypothetical protein n=1 Tax=Hymenobacter psoromatis TaxID=1484116 RepID=UPI001CBDE609|nr:hypothetical protein [Hymenobacter psoromatis]
MKGFVEIPTQPVGGTPTSGFSSTLVAIDAIATVSAHGPDTSRIVLKTIGLYPTGIMNDTLIVGMTYRFLKEELEKAIG